MNIEPRKERILQALDAFTRQRAGLEFGNYGDVKTYRAEQRQITRDLHDYRILRSAVLWRDGITADALLEAARRAFCGRLTIVERSDGALAVDYCTGQYFPTEYRVAACAVLAAALWAYTRENMPEPISLARAGVSLGDWLRSYFRREFGPRLARRYFD